jgi:HAD superfamily hydrolase (TIGR01509 family)
MFDSLQANIHYYNHLLESFGFPAMTEKQVDFVHMATAGESIRHIFEGTGLEKQARAYAKELDYTPFIKDMKIEPGLKTLLKGLKPRYGLAVATNRSTTIGQVLETNGLAPYFDIVVSSLDVQHPKPHPEYLYKILRFFNISPAEAVYIGDSLVDWETARTAGVTFIAYGNMSLETPWKINQLLSLEKILEKL